ncbi:hypothetical protein LZ575_13430 [Antarcticibacterium sp. 1MA-6-2]|uniref:hypothetical protein n=1 Tax=Antarcticibacterium sp. 1MA-6-2 TaxID=2908210 RepID=UPI001F24EA26|nr:hypothetical protein [Antarcticibacterium sp. 1MA-6-2]UJH89959.1 hypothetical protein LZ575_13430 [Antarcticibacterium sp. 1MA-6-2]
MVQLWDDLFQLCEKHEMRLLITPVDTYWMWLRWKHHPYNKKNGGPCVRRSEWLMCKETREAIKNRFTFFISRWGGSGALFAWDLWNEIHPAHCGGKSEYIIPFISEISDHVRNLELKLYGRSHLQTVSIFGPQLDKNPELADAIFRHPKLDFASSHFYDAATINNPKDTVQSAVVTGKLVREALQHITDNRPFLDSEHGPIYAFKNRKRILPEAFDDEYFKHIQWAHLASGGAGGGMRWPYRHPHVLTEGMRREQIILSKFSNLVKWKTFRRKNINEEIRLSSKAFTSFGCSDSTQAIVYLLRIDAIKRKQINKKAKPVDVKMIIPEMASGTFLITEFNTHTGSIEKKWEIVQISPGNLILQLYDLTTDLAVLVQAISEGKQV